MIRTKILMLVIALSGCMALQAQDGLLKESIVYRDTFKMDVYVNKEGMRERVPGSGVFIWDDFMQDDENALTMHTILMSHHFYTTLGNKTSIAQWLDDAVNGKVCSFGLELLDKKY